MKLTDIGLLTVIFGSLGSCAQTSRVEYEGGEIEPITSETILHDDSVKIGQNFRYTNTPRIDVTLVKVDVDENKATFRVTMNGSVDKTIIVGEDNFIKVPEIPELKGMLLQKVRATFVILTAFEAR